MDELTKSINILFHAELPLWSERDKINHQIQFSMVFVWVRLYTSKGLA